MARLKRLSGDDVIAILASFGFLVDSQKGSHVKLLRLKPDGSRETLTVPRHKELDTGTVRALYRQSTRFIPADDLWGHFYSA